MSTKRSTWHSRFRPFIGTFCKMRVAEDMLMHGEGVKAFLCQDPVHQGLAMPESPLWIRCLKKLGSVHLAGRSPVGLLLSARATGFKTWDHLQRIKSADSFIGNFWLAP